MKNKIPPLLGRNAWSWVCSVCEDALVSLTCAKNQGGRAETMWLRNDWWCRGIRPGSRVTRNKRSGQGHFASYTFCCAETFKKNGKSPQTQRTLMSCFAAKELGQDYNQHLHRQLLSLWPGMIVACSRCSPILPSNMSDALTVLLDDEDQSVKEFAKGKGISTL